MTMARRRMCEAIDDAEWAAEWKAYCQITYLTHCPGCGSWYDGPGTDCYQPDPTRSTWGWSDRYCAVLGWNITTRGEVINK
jgi:hypothetical protein